ncbi:Ig-like domain-containing protein [uncultured Methanobrevibacter sp.]|uniref:Ig-like domain-containing protein n=1 Tax=uncultured Methanobrevibacter sp. TaxID=253161 RepID=UPI0025E3CB81|nr:Ig-like domain-containing protein [uncultured Methanobrevibacter sp.]
MKKISIIVFLVLFMSIAAVSAGDLNQTNKSDIDFNVSENYNLSIDDASEDYIDLRNKVDDSIPHNLDDISTIDSYSEIQHYDNEWFNEINNLYKNQSLFSENNDADNLNIDSWARKYFDQYYNNFPFAQNQIIWDLDNKDDSNPCIQPAIKFKFIWADDLVKFYGNSKRFEARAFTNNNPNYVIFSINGQEYQRPIEDNHASIAINLSPGIYNVTSYNPQFNDSVRNTITVLSTVESNDLVKYYKNASRFEVRLLDSNGNHLNASQNVTFNINGVLYTRTTNSEGIAGLNINLNPGQYIITTNNPSTGEYASNKITILSCIESNDLVKYYKNDSQFLVKVLNKTEGNVTFNINGVFYTKQINKTGYAKLNINLNPGNYIITTAFGDYVNSNRITVLSKLYANDLDMFERDGSKFLVKLLDDNGNRLDGKTVTFNINGVFYNRTTDENGIARLNINLNAGNYVITSIYDGLAVSNNIKISSEPITDPHMMVSPKVRSAIFDEMNDTGFKILSFDTTYDMNYRAHLCNLNGNHIGFLYVTEDGKIIK